MIELSDNGFRVRILLDSLAPCGKRLITFELTYPRFIHSEIMTHRTLSRNAASSRAIPTNKIMDRISKSPVIPTYWGKNQKGMQAEYELTAEEQVMAEEEWLDACNDALKHANRLLGLGVHKQIVNRILEPWMWITTIVSATEWGNFFNLRCHPDAQPEFKKIADMVMHLFYSNAPRVLAAGEWHIPLSEDVLLSEFTIDEKIKISVGRCARTSYLTHHGIRDFTADIELHDKLSTSGHWSPFEHVGMACETDVKSGNFVGWLQYRKMFANENQELYVPASL